MGRGKSKFCPRCKLIRPLSSFGPAGKRAASYCRECHRLYAKEWHKNHKEEQKAYRKEWRKLWYPLWYKKMGAEYRRECHLRNRYGITIEDYENLFLRQDKVCFICRKLPKGRNRLSVDHNHKTGVVRGLLCYTCNKALGWFKDSPERLRLAADYLENPPAEEVIYEAKKLSRKNTSKTN